MLTLPDHGSLTTSGLRAWCTLSGGDKDNDNDDVVGGVTIFSGAIMQLGQTTIVLPQKPAPNTVIDLPADPADTITLNYQTIHNGVPTFAAIRAVLPGGQIVTLAAAQCGFEER